MNDDKNDTASSADGFDTEKAQQAQSINRLGQVIDHEAACDRDNETRRKIQRNSVQHFRRKRENPMPSSASAPTTEPSHGNTPSFREERAARLALDNASSHTIRDDDESKSELPGAHRVRGIRHADGSSSSFFDDDNTDSADGSTLMVQAELAHDIDSILAENVSLKARLEQLELERRQMLVVNATPSPTNNASSPAAAAAAAVGTRVYSKKMDITKASKLVCETTDEIDNVFSMKSPANSQAGIASGVKNIGKGMAAGVAGFLGEVISGCASGKGASRAAMGVGRGILKIFVFPAAGAVVGILQIGRGFANSVSSATGNGPKDPDKNDNKRNGDDNDNDNNNNNGPEVEGSVTIANEEVQDASCQLQRTADPA